MCSSYVSLFLACDERADDHHHDDTHLNVLLSDLSFSLFLSLSFLSFPFLYFTLLYFTLLSLSTPTKSYLPSEQLVQHTPKREPIGAAVVRLALT